MWIENINYRDWGAIANCGMSNRFYSIAPASWTNWLPLGLTLLRAGLAPVIFVLLIQQHFVAAAGIYLTALISDIYDGVIARKLGIATRGLRLADSYADIVFFLGLGFGILIGFPHSLTSLALPFWLAIGLTLINWAFCLLKFKQMTSYHSMLMKLSALVLFVGILCLLIGQVTAPLGAAFWLIVVATVEEIAMTAVLREYHHDVWNLKAALALREGSRV